MCYAAAVGLWVEAYVVKEERFEAQRLVECAEHLRQAFDNQEAQHQQEDNGSDAYIAREMSKKILELKMGNNACEVYKQCLHAKSFSPAEVDFLVQLVPFNVNVYCRGEESRMVGQLQVRGQVVSATFSLCSIELRHVEHC
jgi:hypothetical protein